MQDLRDNKGFLAKAGGEEISVFKIDGEFLAIGNVCPHQHFSKLHDGEVKGFTVTCPMHGWTYRRAHRYFHKRRRKGKNVQS